ncbi:transposase [Planctellipticum variicoloris]|uniref:transposase n=1 Tax=Planctellipticum variicoloris TaxID=3064265 RepID=UPI003013863C|nr:transposase [Planctomycetaceae bacterium SH412]
MKELTAIEGRREDTALFVLLWELTQRYPRAKQIRVILGNFANLTTKLLQSSLATPLGRKLRLHFLPPHCPDHNRIERTWEDQHANVTRKHQCATMPQLMRNISSCIRQHNHRRSAAAA